MEKKPRVARRADEWIWRIVFAVILGAFGVWTLICSYERFAKLQVHPDVTGDGRFTISDVLPALFQILTEVGVRYQALIASQKWGRFLEMSADNPSVFWTIVLTMFSFWAGFGGPWIMLFSKKE